MTDMAQPLGQMAGNWIEIMESVELLRGERQAGSEDLRELSLVLAGWMISLGGKAGSAEDGYRLAEGDACGWFGAEAFHDDGGGAGWRSDRV